MTVEVNVRKIEYPIKHLQILDIVNTTDMEEARRIIGKRLGAGYVVESVKEVGRE